MKSYKILILFLLSLFYVTSWGDTIIQMEEYGGVYRIPCSVNGAKMKFIFDTGASNVCLSLPMAEYLFDNDFITKDDIVGTGSSSVADGRIVDHIILNIKDIEITGNHLYNVRAIVIDGQNAPLLMGQSAIKQLGEISLNNNVLIIHNTKPIDTLTEDEVQSLIEKAMNYSDNQLDWKAAEIYADLYDMDLLSDYGKFLYGESLFYSENYERAIDVLEKISEFSYFKENDIDLFNTLAYCYSNIGDYKSAIRKLKEGQSLLQLSNKNLGLSNYALSVNYGLLGREDLAIKFAWDTFNNYASMFNIKPNILWDHCIGKTHLNNIDNTGWLDDIVDNVVRANFVGEKWSYEKMLLVRKQLAQQGFPSSISYCNNNEIEF